MNSIWLEKVGLTRKVVTVKANVPILDAANLNAAKPHKLIGMKPERAKLAP
ncbi:hypothetical protein [Afipia sp. Root123D2]|uniref:hypothetical protein n=1 Tax=Afipia sp. Root123D2 TaxID=1736436 RepID=UPI0012E8A892|nr:hypothetical protein [Afipia sp. Root123D2]